MPSRQYKCPLCHSAFRNESGMKWHIAHKHEIELANIIRSIIRRCQQWETLYNQC